MAFPDSPSFPTRRSSDLNVTFTDGTTSADDFTHTLVPVTFLAGNNTAQVILVATTADATVEADETLTAHLALATMVSGGVWTHATNAGRSTSTTDKTAVY